MYEYRCKIVEWKDGDTVLVDLDLGFHATLRESVRVYGINTPEIRSRDADEKRRGIDAKMLAIALAPVGALVRIRTVKASAVDKYGRFLGAITLADGRDFATEMIRANVALPWDGQGERPI